MMAKVFRFCDYALELMIVEKLREIARRRTGARPKVTDVKAPRQLVGSAAIRGDLVTRFSKFFVPGSDRARIREGYEVLKRIKRVLIEEFQNINLRLILAGVLASLLPNTSLSRVRTALYRLAGLKIGTHSLIFGRISFTGIRAAQRRLSIGANTMINEDVFMDVNAEIRIGDHVSIGHHTMFITADHEVGPSWCRAGALRNAPIEIGAGSWIGAHSTILPGITIGAGCIVAAGSLVSGNVPAHTVVDGVPARPVKSLPADR